MGLSGQKARGAEPALLDEDDRIVVSSPARLDRDRTFECLVKRYYRQVRGFFGNRIFSAEECEDLTQEVFRRVYQGLNEFRAEARFRTWLFQIVHNTYRSWLRGRPPAREDDREISAQIRQQPPAFEGRQPIAATAETPLTASLEKERLEMLRGAVGELPRQMQECIRLRVYHDCSYKEIAELMELSIETVKVHLHKARAKLRTSLQGYFENVDF